MGFVIKVTDDQFGVERWVAPETTTGPHQLGGKDEALVFPTHADAETEVRVLQNLFGDRFHFEIEPN